jgi:hypothetical protein
MDCIVDNRKTFVFENLIKSHFLFLRIITFFSSSDQKIKFIYSRIFYPLTFTHRCQTDLGQFFFLSSWICIQLTSKFHIESNQPVSLSLVFCLEHEIKRKGKSKFAFFLIYFLHRNHFYVKYLYIYTKEHAVNCIILSRRIITSCVLICTHTHICINQQ